MLQNPKLGIDIALDGSFTLLTPTGSTDIRVSQTNDFALTGDVAGVRQALVKRLNTRKGGLWAHPEYGCGIWDILSEPMTDTWYMEATAIVRECIHDDPRTSVIGVSYQAVPQERCVAFTIVYSVEDGRQDNLIWNYRSEEVTGSV